MTEAAYIAVREALRKSLPGRVTTTWVMANVGGYKAEGSAKALVRYMSSFGLLDADGTPTALAKKWRMDESYGEACEQLLRNAFPADVVEAMPPDGDAEVLVNLFMARGFGEGSSKNLARIYRLISSKALPGPRKAKVVGNESRKPPQPKSRVPLSETHESKPEPSEMTTPAETGYTVLRYFLDQGRMAEVRVPRDMDEKERKRLFAHLRIDLLDEVMD